MLSEVLNAVIYKAMCILHERQPTNQYWIDHLLLVKETTPNLQYLYDPQLLQVVISLAINSKVDVGFQWEKVIINSNDDKVNGMCLWKSNNLLNFHTIDDIEIFGFAVGAPYEIPVYQLFYLDNQQQLRYYIPKEGNVFNTIFNRAYGNDWPNTLDITLCKLNINEYLDSRWDDSDIRDLWNNYKHKILKYIDDPVNKNLHNKTFKDIIYYVGYNVEKLKREIQFVGENAIGYITNPTDLRFNTCQRMLFNLYYITIKSPYNQHYTDYISLMKSQVYADQQSFLIDYNKWSDIMMIYCSQCKHFDVKNNICPLWKLDVKSQCCNKILK